MKRERRKKRMKGKEKLFKRYTPPVGSDVFMQVVVLMAMHICTGCETNGLFRVSLVSQTSMVALQSSLDLSLVILGPLYRSPIQPN